MEIFSTIVSRSYRLTLLYSISYFHLRGNFKPLKYLVPTFFIRVELSSNRSARFVKCYSQGRPNIISIERDEFLCSCDHANVLRPFRRNQPSLQRLKAFRLEAMTISTMSRATSPPSPAGKVDSFRGCSGGDRWCVAFHRTRAYEPPLWCPPPLSLFSLFSLVSRYSSLFGGRENKLKIASERIAVGTFEAAAREPATVVDRSHRVSSSGC